MHTFPSPAPQSVGLDPTYLNAVRDGLWQATHSTYGTSQMVFGSFPVPIAGKTGTAQKIPRHRPARPVLVVRLRTGGKQHAAELVVCALIENGGFGGDAAAPAALQVFKQYFHDRLDAGQVAATG